MKHIKHYVLPNGDVPFEKWANTLSTKAKTVVLTYLGRLSLGGSKKNIKALGNSIFEVKINYESGYRIYFGEKGRDIILLLVGGNKRTQKKDISLAKKYWRDYNA